MKSVAIVGGGIMGVTVAYRLSQQGFQVTVYERSPNLGGLTAYMDYDGLRLDRFYHTILSSDLSMQTLIEESGVADKRHFTSTKQGFYDKGHIYPFSTPVDFLQFPPLNPLQRFRLGLQIIYAQTESDWKKMDVVPVEDWLVKVSGRGVYEKVWKPLLRAKFDTISGDVPATYIWSRLRRMMGTRKGVTSKEMMCYLENGYYTVVEALVAKAEAQGAVFQVNAPIEQILIEDGRAVGVRVGGADQRFDAVVSTLASPVLAGLLPAAPTPFTQKLSKQEYLGVICPLLILRKRLLPFYVLNITDESIPFTAVVETTNLIDPQHVKGYHLVYLPKYIAPDNPMAEWSDERIKTEWMKYFRQMFPTYDEKDIAEFVVQRARYVEPIRPMNTLDDIPTIQTPVKQLYMGNTVMIYPDLGNGEAATRYAEKVVAQVIADAPQWVHQSVGVS
jgi:protoporphyrinogen oxidase